MTKKKAVKPVEVPSLLINWRPLSIEKHPHLRTRGEGYESMLSTKVKAIHKFIDYGER